MVANASQPTAPQIDDMRRVLNGRIPASIVLAKTEPLPPEERDAILWFHAHYWDEGLSLNEAGELVGYDGSTMSRVFRGEYAGQRATVVAKIEAFRTALHARSQSRKMPWQPTEFGAEIQENCDVARNYQAIVCGFGESQVGKSENLRHIAAEDKEGTTLYFEIPPGAREGEFLPVICRALHLSSRTRTGEVWLTIADHLRVPGLLVIVDEGARAGGKREYGGGNFRLIERLRWLQEKCGFGLFFCGTNLTRDQFLDAEHEKYLNQWNRRCLRKVQFPDMPSRKDLNVFSRYYGLEQATGDARLLEKTVISTLGLGQWLKTLALAQVRAQNASQRLTWDHVIRAYAWMKGGEDIKRTQLNTEVA